MKKDIEEKKLKTEAEINAEIKRLKEVHDKVYKIKIPVGNEFTTILLKDMDRLTYKAVQNVSHSDELRATEVFLSSCYIGGDELKPVTSDIRSLISAGRTLAKLLHTEESDFSEV